MNHAVFAGCKFYKRAEVHYSYNLTDKFVANFRIFCNSQNDILSFLRHDLVSRCDKHHTVVGNIDFNTRLLDNLIDRLSAASDNFSYLFGINREGNNLGRILGKLSSRLVDNFHHLTENIHSALLGLLQRSS